MMAPLSPSGLFGLLTRELQELYSAEHQMLKALPRLIEAVTDKLLKSTMEERLSAVEDHIMRLTSISESLDMPIDGQVNKSVKGLVEESDDLILDIDNAETRDAAIIGTLTRLSHCEMAAYDTAASHAQLMQLSRESAILKQSLKEEGVIEKKLARLARNTINRKALSP